MTMTRESDEARIPGPESGAASAAPAAIEGRSLRRIAWNRLKKDRLALSGGVVVVLLILAAVFAGPLSALSGNDPDSLHNKLIDPNFQIPYGGMGGMSGQHWLGVDLPNGRDIFSRILYGARVSLGIAGVSTLVAIAIGTAMGLIAGYFGGWIDAVISRTMDVFLAFPLLLFAIAIIGVLPDDSFGLSGSGLRFGVLVVVIGFVSWPYIGRIVRGQTIALREREFVAAARSLGAGPARIIVRELLPNLLAPILVYATLLIPANILFEAGLSFLGVGVKDPTPSWGAMINSAIATFQIDPEYLIVPGTAIFVTVLAFNLLGDGLRDAFDPKGSR